MPWGLCGPKVLERRDKNVGENATYASRIALDHQTKGVSLLDRRMARTSRRMNAFVSAVILLPIMSAVASYFGIQPMLLAIFFVLGASTLFAILSRTKRACVDSLYMGLIMCVASSLLLSSSLMSDSLHGWDIHQEYSIFLKVSTSGVWHAEGNLLYNSALSIGILPSMLSIVSALNGIQIFMVLWPMLFSMVPVILYRIYRKMLPPESAFLSVFLFMSYPSFYDEMVQLARQEIAVLMLILLVGAFLSLSSSKERGATIMILILTIGLVTAHYSMGYIFIFLLAFSLIVSRISQRVTQVAGLGILMFLAVTALGWYLLVAGGTPLTLWAQFLSAVGEGLMRDFFNPASRPAPLLMAMGLSTATPGFLHDLNRITQYLVVFCLMLGFVIFVARRQKTTPEKAMLSLILGSFTLLAFSALLPFFAGRLNFSRIYSVALLFISPCFVYGAKALESAAWSGYRLLHRDPQDAPARCRRTRILGATILFLYFLFMSGWVWSVSADRPTSLILDRERIRTHPILLLRTGYYDEYTLAQDIAAAHWLRSHTEGGGLVCADQISREHVLNSYGELPREGPLLPSGCDFSKSYVYLSSLNTLYGMGAYGNDVWFVSQISADLMTMNRISSDGATIYSGFQ